VRFEVRCRVLPNSQNVDDEVEIRSDAVMVETRSQGAHPRLNGWCRPLALAGVAVADARGQNRGDRRSSVGPPPPWNVQPCFDNTPLLQKSNCRWGSHDDTRVGIEILLFARGGNRFPDLASGSYDHRGNSGGCPGGQKFSILCLSLSLALLTPQNASLSRLC